MNNELVSSTQIATEIAENATRFTEFLSSNTVAPVRKTITIIPNVIKDILDVTLEHKQLKLQDSQLRHKVELAQKYLVMYNENSKRQTSLELEKIHANSNMTIAEIAQKRDCELAKIETEKEMKLSQIESNEHLKKAELQSQYELGKQQLDNQMKMFQMALQESNQRFYTQMKSAEKIQAEFSQLIKVITKKIVKGTATEYEYKALDNLASLKIQALQNNFNISDGFLHMFARGD